MRHFFHSEFDGKLIKDLIILFELID